VRSVAFILRFPQILTYLSRGGSFTDFVFCESVSKVDADFHFLCLVTISYIIFFDTLTGRFIFMWKREREIILNLFLLKKPVEPLKGFTLDIANIVSLFFSGRRFTSRHW